MFTMICDFHPVSHYDLPPLSVEGLFDERLSDGGFDLPCLLSGSPLVNAFILLLGSLDLVRVRHLVEVVVKPANHLVQQLVSVLLLVSSKVSVVPVMQHINLLI